MEILTLSIVSQDIETIQQKKTRFRGSLEPMSFSFETFTSFRRNEIALQFLSLLMFLVPCNDAFSTRNGFFIEIHGICCNWCSNSLKAKSETNVLKEMVN